MKDLLSLLRQPDQMDDFDAIKIGRRTLLTTESVRRLAQSRSLA